MRAQGERWTQRSLLISLIIHGIIFIFLALYFIGPSMRVQEFVHAIFVPESEPKKLEPRPRPVRPISRPVPPRTQVVDTDIIPVATPKRSSPLTGRTVKTNVLLKAADESLVQDVASPSSLARDRILPKVMTTAKVPPADLSLSISVSGDGADKVGTGGRMGIGEDGMGVGKDGRSRTGLPAVGPASDRQPLSMIREHAALNVSDSLADVAKGVILGPSRVPPLPKGEPGGIVIGRGKDIEGRIRFSRLKHSLADWWADPTSVSGLMYWMNGRTNVHADINIEGGALRLDSPKLIKCPLVIMTGHDRIVLNSSSISGNYMHRFTDSERGGLRRYLIEAGGLLFFDACGHDAMLARQVESELRTALPEYTMGPISNRHELYLCYYEIGGPPPGARRFWKHGNIRLDPSARNRYLDGLFINNRLVAIISDRDYLCAARTKNRPGHGYTGESSPSSYRFLTNVVMYSLMYGGISDNSDYIPEMTDKDRISIDAPVQIPVLLPE